MNTKHCEFCDFTYSISDHIMKGIHTRRHKKYERILEEYGSVPMAYTKREFQKKLAYNMIKEATNQKEKINGILKLYDAYWHNSFHLSIGRNQWRNHPKFDQYVSMLDLDKDFLTHEIKQEIIKNYGQMRGQIAPNKTDWAPPRTKARKMQFEEKK